MSFISAAQEEAEELLMALVQEDATHILAFCAKKGHVINDKDSFASVLAEMIASPNPYYSMDIDALPRGYLRRLYEKVMSRLAFVLCN